MPKYAPGAKLAVANSWTANQTYNNDNLLRLGTDGDIVFVNVSGAQSANASITDVTAGTPVYRATTANSLFVSNITQDGDIILLANRGGNSEQYIQIDASGGILSLISPNGNLNFDTDSEHRIRTEAGGNRFAFLTSSGDVQLMQAGGDLDINAGFIQLAEMSAPGAGAADHVRIYAEDDGGGLTDLSAVFQDGTIVDFAEEVTPLDAPIHVSPSGTPVTLRFMKPHPGISEIVAVFPGGGTHRLWRAKFHDAEKIAANTPGSDAPLPIDWLVDTAAERAARAKNEDQGTGE